MHNVNCTDSEAAKAKARNSEVSEWQQDCHRTSKADPVTTRSLHPGDFRVVNLTGRW